MREGDPVTDPRDTIEVKLVDVTGLSIHDLLNGNDPVLLFAVRRVIAEHLPHGPVTAGFNSSMTSRDDYDAD
jgi:FXSXX-COOH protein